MSMSSRGECDNSVFYMIAKKIYRYMFILERKGGEFISELFDQI